jgi:hypothetical protein
MLDIYKMKITPTNGKNVSSQLSSLSSYLNTYTIVTVRIIKEKYENEFVKLAE